jgi:hypothetical protein
MCVENLKAVYDRASRRDVTIAADSYPKYNRLVGRIAAKHGYSLCIGAAVFAALSPNNDYWGNLRDTDTLLAGAAAGKTVEDVSVHTYGHNKRKAWAIAHGADPYLQIIASKTRNFFLNVLDPTDPVPVTIDGHMYNVWHGVRRNLVGLRVPNSLYEVVADGVRSLAAEKECLPCVVQGVLWITWKKIHRIRISPQGEFWDPDYLAANLGFWPEHS